MAGTWSITVKNVPELYYHVIQLIIPASHPRSCKSSQNPYTTLTFFFLRAQVVLVTHIDPGEGDDDVFCSLGTVVAGGARRIRWELLCIVLTVLISKYTPAA